MKKERKFFWCAGSPCGYDKHAISELAQELESKKLCKKCYDNGLRLKMEAVVYRPINGGK